MPLIKELINIPEQVNKGDFVLRLTEGVQNPDQTLINYVVTDQLAKCFDHALSFIRSAVIERTSKAAYLHGSFGSGKSHFMAVLHLILQGNTQARSIPELAEVITKHNPWIGDKKFLLVPYHMIGAKNMESALLGGYADFVQRAHQDAHLPGVYLAEKIFQDAESLRQRMGDDAFFQALSEATGDDDGWGDLGAGWTAERFDRAVASPPGDEDRLQLVGDLVATFFSSQQEVSKSSGEGFINLDDGLSVMSKHAKGLGYDVIILFLDELILWLASHSADLGFVQLEGQKLAKLVEAQTPDRPVPIVSLVARQRDLRDLVGKEVAGAAAMNFSDILGHWEGRFDTITLEDRNLPKIAEKRILVPMNDAARGQIDAAFEQTAKLREEVMHTLLTSEGDRQMFRQVYPFSPALMQTLIAVSSVLQRERTALKVMLQLLVGQRDTMRLGDVVPVGDLFDVIAHGEEAFNEEMRIQFDNAKRLYHQKLLPLLEKQHGLRREAMEELSYEDPKRIGFLNDDRLIKTLLLGALVPGVESLKGLTANRLAALNHGTIKSPIPGREGQMVTQRVKRWAAEVGEIKVGEENNPSISLQLSGVDTESIIDQARREDNSGNRIRYVREMLYDQLGISSQDTFTLEHKLIWRNTPRYCEVVYGNVRKLPDSALRPHGDVWKLIIDYPFDDPPHGPRDDISRLQQFVDDNPSGCRTVAWVPSFLSSQSQKDLGLLVIIEYVLTGERYRQYSGHLSVQDQAAAKALLKNQQSMLRQRVLNHLFVAYGLDLPNVESIDTSHDLSEHFISLQPGFTPQPPVAPTLKGAMENLFDQALAHQFPAHPYFEAETKIGPLKKVSEVVCEAARTADGRIPVDRSVRQLVRQIANPLMLGEMAETHFVIGQHWKNLFTRKAAETGGTITVGQLREWTDLPKPMGLPEEAANLVILLFAEQTNRTFYLHGVLHEGTITSLRNDLELREQVLPSKDAWEKAVDRAGIILGIAVSKLLNATNFASFTGQMKEKCSAWRKPCQDLCNRLTDKLKAFDIDIENAPRMQTATATLTLLDKISRTTSDMDVVEALANADVITSETAMGQSIANADGLVQRIEATEWDVFLKTGQDTDAEIQVIRDQITEVLRADEHVTSLGAALKGAQSRAIAILTRKKETPTPSPPVGPPKPKPPVKRKHVIDRGEENELGVAEVKTLLTELEGKLGHGCSLRMNLSWIIEEEREE